MSIQLKTKPRIRLRLGIAVVFLSVMLPLTIGMTGILYLQNSRLATEQAQTAMNGATHDVVQGMRTLLGSMARVVNLSVTYGKSQGEAIRRVESMRFLVDIMESSPDLYALFFAFQGDGAFYEVFHLPAPEVGRLIDRHPPADAKFALRIIETTEGDRADNWIYFSKWGEVLGVERAPKAVYDPRPREWYKSAVQTKGIATSSVHILSSLGLPGLTLSQKITTDDGEVVGVFAADMLTETLSRFLASHSVGKNGRVFLLDEDGRMLGYPDWKKSMVIQGNTLEISKAENMDDPIVAGAVKKRAQGLGDNFRAELGADGEPYLVSFTAFPEDFGKNWTIGVVAAEREFIGPLRTASVRILEIEIIFLILTGAGIAWGARLLTQPIQILTDETNRIRALDLTGTINVPSQVIEIHTLAEALQSMKAALSCFAAYVPKDLVRQIIDLGSAGGIGGERRQLSILFTDLKGFTATSEFMSPEDVAFRLSIYFEEMSAAILGTHGTIDKFIGDAIMAFWNAPTLDPDHVANACRAVLACRAISEQMSEDFAANNFAPMPTRFGLHLGQAVVGNVGSSDRMQYTALGAAVNLASRIEGINKMYGTSALVTGEVEQEVRGRFLFRNLGLVAPSGVSQPVALFELIACLEEGAPSVASPETLDRIGLWEHAFQLHQNRDWQAALQAFADFTERFPEDGPGKMFLELVQHYAQNPPSADWDGVYRPEGK